MIYPPFQALDEDAIRRGLAADVATRVRVLEVLEETASTNDRLLCEVDVGAAGLYVCLAEMQTAGRGRRGRKVWHSPRSGNLYLSVMRCGDFAPPRSAWFALTAAAEIISALAADGVNGLGLKWPNDIYSSHTGREGKLGGVLVEAKGNRCVIGVGLNLHLPAHEQPAFGAGGGAWIALDEIGHEQLDRRRLAARMIVALVRAFDRVESNPLEVLIENWSQYDLLAGREITVLAEGGALTGVARGVDAHGGLRVEHNSRGASDVRVYYSDDVSIRW